MKQHIFWSWTCALAIPMALYHLALRLRGSNPGSRLSRRSVLKLAGLVFTAVTTGAWKSRSMASGPGLAPRCVLTPEQTEGPYYVAREKVRANITERRAGTPLRLRFTVMDAATCKPISGAAVDIWHCDASGIYSGFQAESVGGIPGGNAGPTDRATFLRGIQFTNARGYAEFHTIYPGWYRGRTVHIHVKVHLDRAVVGHVAHTGQLYFPDSLTGKVYRSAPYRSRAAARDTFNNTDSIYQTGGSQSMLTLAPDGHGGYIGAITLGVRKS